MVSKIQLNESVGKVLWHSLDESGRIGEYDMKFGDTVIRGILPEEVTPVKELTHEHKIQKRDEE